MAVPVAPPDASGGYMVIQYTDGTDTHRMRVHVLPFSTTEFSVSGALTSTDDGNHNYAYTGSRPAGSELGINDTFAGFMGVLKAEFSTVWTFSLLSLYQNVAGTLTEVFPVPTPTPVAGTNAAGAPTGQQRAMESVYTFRTSGGHHARIICIGQHASMGLYVPATVSPTSGSNAADQALVGYLTGANTGIVGHDNMKLQSPCHLTFAANRRLRRHYGYA